MENYQGKNMIAESAPESLQTHVKANDDIVSQLMRIWRELLGLESIGIDQNYFDLGGDSSIAVQMFAQIEKAFHVKLPLATLYDAPTIQDLAQILRGEASSSGWSPLVAIQTNGSRPPIFCFHGAGGNVLNYRDLSKHLGTDQPFYGLQSQGLDGSCPPLTKIEDMAALYVKDIRKIQAHGPYLLAGYCGGGTIAFEAAQQLQAMNEPIALLALFDTMDWSQIRLTIWNKSYYRCQRLVFHAAEFMNLNWDGKTKFFDEKMTVLWNRIPVWRGMLRAKFGSKSEAAKSESSILAQIWRTNDKACENYVPKLYPGVVTDFRPTKQYRMFNKPNVKWDRLAKGGQNVVTLPVYPASMLLEPFVKDLATALKKSIDSAMESGPVR